MSQTVQRHQQASEAEWEVRIQLAACYRILHRFRMTDTINTHVAARLPGAEERFLLNPYGLLFNEVRASNLVTVDRDGHVAGLPTNINAAGFSIHSAVFRARRCRLLSPHPYARRRCGFDIEMRPSSNQSICLLFQRPDRLSC